MYNAIHLVYSKIVNMCISAAFRFRKNILVIFIYYNMVCYIVMKWYLSYLLAILFHTKVPKCMGFFHLVAESLLPISFIPKKMKIINYIV